jgi:hypothetical protein
MDIPVERKTQRFPRILVTAWFLLFLINLVLAGIFVLSLCYFLIGRHMGYGALKMLLQAHHITFDILSVVPPSKTGHLI